MSQQTPPRWNLKNVYPSLDSEEYASDFNRMRSLLSALEDFLAGEASQLDATSSADEIAKATANLIERFNDILLLAATLRPYLESFIATDSYDKNAQKKLSQYEMTSVRTHQAFLQARAWFGKVAEKLPAAVPLHETVSAHAFFVREEVEQSRYLMTEAEESLAAELNLSAGNAWEKLQGTLTSQLSVDFDLDGRIQRLSMPALINLRTHPVEDVRRRAYEEENRTWPKIQESLAAAMNGIKGQVNTLNQRRGRLDALHGALDRARMDRETLDSMLEAMQDSLPDFHRYFKTKAARFGYEKLPWWNLFAPSGESKTIFTFEEARDFILRHFESFSPDLRSFARHAFDNNWIDAEQREGKRGGAFCMEVAGVGESRILCNFDGSLDQVSTLAHELGHAFHNDCMVRAKKTELQKNIPMTQAETASIMCETIVTTAALKKVKSEQEELAILETRLIGNAQVIVDIYSRFLFEKEVFERRLSSELSAEELCEIMESCQKKAYGDALDERYLQKWMWTWKPHYYSADLSFYNFPYAFGLLFGTGLYSIYQKRGAAFVEDYEKLLACTGEGTAAELAARFGIDLRQKFFWNDGLKIIKDQISRYCSI